MTLSHIYRYIESYILLKIQGIVLYFYSQHLLIRLRSRNTPQTVLISHFIILCRRSIRLKKGSVGGGGGAGAERKKSEQNESEEGKELRQDRPDTQ